MNKKLYLMLLGACGAVAPQASAQEAVVVTEVTEVVEVVEIVPEYKLPRFAIKGYDDIGLGKCMSIDNSQTSELNSSSYNAFGVDFGYTFWRKGEHSLEANIGIGYSISGAKFAIPDMSYHYSAPSEADEDGNPYERYMELSDFRQKVGMGYFKVPIYLEYQYKPLRWLGIYAQVGVGLGFRVYGSTGGSNGRVYSYGIFPEYDDLKIDEDYLDYFGNRAVDAYTRKTSMKGFDASIMCGAGFEFYAYEPVSFVLGVRYNAGLTNCFNGKFNGNTGGVYTAENAPITYTVKDGFIVNSLADYTTKSKLSPLSLHLGINVRF